MVCCHGEIGATVTCAHDARSAADLHLAIKAEPSDSSVAMPSKLETVKMKLEVAELEAPCA